MTVPPRGTGLLCLVPPHGAIRPGFGCFPVPPHGHLLYLRHLGGATRGGKGDVSSLSKASKTKAAPSRLISIIGNQKGARHG